MLLAEARLFLMLLSSSESSVTLRLSILFYSHFCTWQEVYDTYLSASVAYGSDMDTPFTVLK